MIELLQSAPPVPYEEWRRVSADVKLHTRGVGITDLLRIQRPHEPDYILDYRVSQSYRYTAAVFQKGINAVTRALKESQVSASGSPEVMARLEGEKFSNGKRDMVLWDWIISTVPNVIDDPNAFIIWEPFNATDNINFEELPVEHPRNTPENAEVGFKPVIIASDRVYYCDEDTLIYEWDYVDVEGKMKPVYMGVNAERFELFHPHYDRKSKAVYYIPEVYKIHELDMPPFIQLGGYETLDKYGRPYYESFFQSAAEYGRDFLTSYSDFKAIWIQTASPVKELRDAPCPACGGQGKRQGENGVERCTACKGAGVAQAFDPYATIVKSSKGGKGEPADTSDTVRFYHPGTDVIESAKGICWEILDKAYESINLHSVRLAQSGTAKEEDKEGYYNMLATITDNMLRLYEFSIECVTRYVYNINKAERVPARVKLVKSVRYNSVDYLTEQAKNKDLHVNIRKKIALELIKRQGDPVETKIAEVLSVLDPYWIYGPEEMLNVTANAQSTISAAEYELHNEGDARLRRLAMEREDFLQMSLEEIERALGLTGDGNS